jgi:hypothetical protein
MVILFGAGSLGDRLIQRHSLQECSQVCLVDNDSSKWGTLINGCVVRRPEETELRSADFVLITSIYVSTIYKQLLAAGVPSSRIGIPSKVLYSDTPFDLSDLTIERPLLAVLESSTFAFRERGLDAFVDFGTLLGLWRDRHLIAGDNDVDSCVVGPLGNEHTLAARILHGAARSLLLDAKLHHHQNHSDILIAVGKFWISTSVMQATRENGTVTPMLTWAPPVPEDVILPLRADPATSRVNMPADPDKYLMLRYGPGWKTPDPDWSVNYSGLDHDVRVVKALAEIGL